jgi:hypothetical protein
VPTTVAPTPPPTAAAAERRGVAEAGTKSTAAAPATPKVRPRAARPSPVELAVEHRHVFGGCQGVLRVSHSGVSFTSDNAKDVFDLEYGRFQSVLGDDSLTIKSDRKTYRFKATKASGGDEDPSPLQRIVTAIEDFRPK